jgi:transcriptional regulator with XRE-family HTH domain
MSIENLFYDEGHEFSVAEQRAFSKEGLIYNVTEDLLLAMERKGITRKELARKLNKSQSYVTQMLSGRRNMTLGTLSDMCFSLDFTPTVFLSDGIKKLGDNVDGGYMRGFELVSNKTVKSSNVIDFPSSNDANFFNIDLGGVAKNSRIKEYA